MGPYYIIANFDKKEQLLPFDYDNGLQLMEWSYTNNPMVNALMNLLATDWKGDRVIVVGDCADDLDPDECWVDVYKRLAKEFALDHVDGDESKSLYNFAESFHRVMPDKQLRVPPLHDADWAPRAFTVGDTSDNLYRYIYNHCTKQFIDLAKLNIERTYFDDAEEAHAVSIAPLPLLLAMGNGRGSGDYLDNHPGFDLVGSWCETVQNIEVSYDIIEGCEDYKEFPPIFTERDQPIPYTDFNKKYAEHTIEHKEPQLGICF